MMSLRHTSFDPATGLIFLCFPFFIGCGSFGRTVRAVDPSAIMSTIDKQGTWLALPGDSILIPMRTCRGVRFLKVGITSVDVDESGEWTIIGCIDDGIQHHSAPGVRVAIARSYMSPHPPASSPDVSRDETSGSLPRAGASELDPAEHTMPSLHLLDPVVWTTTRADGTFELRGMVDAGSCLVVGSGIDLVQVYEVGRLVGE